jgi:hypothetical protein
MSRIGLLILGLAFVAPPVARGQQLLSLGLRAGLSQSTMSLSGGASPSGRTGFLAGPSGMVWLSDGLAIQFEALYVSRGFEPDAAAGVTSALDLSYLDVPITAVLHLPATGSGMLQARLLGGASIGFRVRCSVDQGTGDVTGITDCNPDNVATFDLSLVGGAGLKIGRGRGGLVIDAIYSLGLLDANIGAADLTARNRALMISAGFMFPIM